MGHGSDSDSGSDSSRSSSSSVRSGKVKKDKKDKKDKKEKKEKDHKDGDKKEKKDKGKDKDKKDKEKDKDGKKDKGEKEKDKKDKDKEKKKEKHSTPQPGYAYAYHGQQVLPEPSAIPTKTTTGPISVPAFNPNYPGAHPSGTPAAQPSFSSGTARVTPSFPTPPPPPQPGHGQPTPMSTFSAPPPGYPSQPPTAPASGYRTPLDGDKPFPTDPQELGPPVTQDADGSPIYVGSALFENSVHPCKVGPALSPPARVAYGGRELAHAGRYDLLPFVPDEMEWVPASYGQIPAGRRPVEGGYEENGAKLYHALANINGVQVPGKTGEHLGAVNVGYGGSEYTFPTDYRILCWRY